MWKTAGCAVTGASHQKRSLPCQDKIASLHNEQIDAIALADGAGSASLSHEGAEIVCREILEDLSGRFDLYFYSEDAIRKYALGNLQQKLQDHAESRGCRTCDLYSTLLAAAVHDGRAIILHLGDGVIGEIRGGEVQVLSEPTNGEYLNETVFVSLPYADELLNVIRMEVEDTDGFVLMSDGSAESLYNRRENRLAPVLARLGKELSTEDADSFSEDLAYTASQVLCRQTSDDCSINFLIREPSPVRLNTLASSPNLPMIPGQYLPAFKISPYPSDF